MRIAEFTDSFLPIVDGVGTVVLSYAGHLAEKGHQCCVMAPKNDFGCRSEYNFEILDFRSVSVLGSYKLGLPMLDRRYHARMESVELDIIHAHSPFSAGRNACNYAKKRDIPLVGTFHSKYRDDFLQATHMNLLADIGVKYVLDFYNKCDEVWAVSQNSADTLRSYGYKKEIYVMPNGMDPQYASPEAMPRAKRQFGLGDKPTFLFVGQINWKKNLERILLAASEVAKSGYDFKLVMAGQGPHFEEVKRKARELNIADKLVMTGHILDRDLLAGLYQCADLFVFPSLYDTASMVMREAAAFGTPSVVARGAGPAEAINDAVNGFLCDDTTKSLTAIMTRAIEEPRMLAEMGLKAQRTIPEGWDGIIDTVLERYQYLIERKTKRESAERQEALV